MIIVEGEPVIIVLRFSLRRGDFMNNMRKLDNSGVFGKKNRTDHLSVQNWRPNHLGHINPWRPASVGNNAPCARPIPSPSNDRTRDVAVADRSCARKRPGNLID